MADPDFFRRSGPFTLAELAQIAGAELAHSGRSDYEVTDVSSLTEAGATDITFLDNIKYKDQFAHTRAGACIVAPEYKELAPRHVALLLSPTPYKSYALVAQAFYPESLTGTITAASISEQALIAKGVIIAENCVIEAGAIIQEGAKIGARSFIAGGAVIGRNVRIGEGCRIDANAVISHCIMGDNVHIFPGVCIGQDGFGFAPDPAGFVKVPQLGRVIIGSGVCIGANTTIDRGAGPDTVIGDGTWIDNLVQIAHNVKIGRNCIIISQVGVSGSAELGDFVVLAGQAGITGHLKIGTGARIGAQSGVMRDVPAGAEVIGSPAMPSKQFLRQVAVLRGLVKKKK